ncbi:IS701 family transposase [Streptomyces marianii]|uniref:IS701 family transposase n=1 Tax=Streptomyces marianii TaxID=1817406 RepID=UPI001F3D802A|nr:transposase [Streptomyces marianii]
MRTMRPQNWTADGDWPGTVHTENRATVLAELGSVLFASLPRRDQRRKGVEYVQGLLGVKGRKSIRNISSLFGGESAEQSLHHFISGSTWDWAPVRRALARHMEEISPTRAHVLRPLVIPKAGDSSVGVDRRFCALRGQIMNAQQAVGVWAVSDESSTPVNWRLHLPDAWLEDEMRRRQASIPDTALPETLDQCAVEAYIGITKGWGLPTRPVVMDAREADLARTVRRLSAAGAPMLLRIGPGERLTVTDPGLPRIRPGLTAYQIMTVARPLRHPVIQQASGRSDASRTGLAACVRVEMPAGPGSARRPAREMVLLGIGESGGRWPAELWLSDIAGAHPAQLLRLARLTRQVDRDYAQIAEEVGISDFSGRSFSGWHRHATLASAAHAVEVLSGTAGSTLVATHDQEARATA